MAVTSLTPSQALRRPRRLDVRLFAGALLAVAMFVGSMLAYQRLSATRDVLVAAADLPAGAVLTASNLRVVAERLDDRTYRAAIPAAERDAVVGATLTAPAFADQILVRAQVTSHATLAPGEEAVVVVLPPDVATGGSFHPGDDVQVLWVKGKTTDGAQASVLLQRVRVLGVAYQSGGPLTGDSARPAAEAGVAALRLAVTEEQAVQLAEAKVVGQLDIALLPPAPDGGPHA